MKNPCMQEILKPGVASILAVNRLSNNRVLMKEGLGIISDCSYKILDLCLFQMHQRLPSKMSRTL